MARRILRKPFYPLEEICERWEMSAEDLAPFVLDGELKLSIPAAGLWVSVGEWVEDESGKRARSPSRTVSIRGPLDLEASDAWWAIRKGSTRIESFAAGGNQYIDVFSGSDPVADFEVLRAELVVRHDQVERFEAKHPVLTVGSPEGQSAGQRGAPPRYDWDAFWCELAVMLQVEGMPPTQAAVIRRMEAWFAERGQFPDPSTVKRKVALLWRHHAEALARPAA